MFAPYFYFFCVVLDITNVANYFDFFYVVRNITNVAPNFALFYVVLNINKSGGGKAGPPTTNKGPGAGHDCGTLVKHNVN